MSAILDQNGNILPIGKGPWEKTDFDKLQLLVDERNAGTLDGAGWADYADGQYTSGSPFSLSADTDTVLPNNGANGPKQFEPADITEIGGYVSGGKIQSLNGDALLITSSLKVTPTSAAATDFELWYDIGGTVGELYRRISGFPKGNGVERTFTFTTLVYTLDTWEANGATVYIRSNGPCNVYAIRHILARQFKAP